MQLMMSLEPDYLVFEKRDWRPKRKFIFQAFCTSVICVNRPQGSKTSDTSTGILKKVPRSKCFCPDCGSALFWRREAESSNKKDRLKKCAS